MNQALSVIERKIQHESIAKEISKDLLQQKFIEAALSLDASIVEPFIPEDMLLQDISKYHFLAHLQKHFGSIRRQHPENWRVQLAGLTCMHCNRGKPLAGFEVFAGDACIPFAKFGYYVATTALGKTTDIYICNMFK